MAHKHDTVTDYQARILKVLLYLQEHPDQPTSVDELAKIACFSPFHFHRIFAAFVGETVLQHTRRIRLERAARWLLNSTDSITDVALDSGYETPAAFGKAFKKQFDKSPTQFREERLALPPRNGSSSLATPKEQTMNPTTIETRSEQRVLFVRKTGKYDQSSQAAWGSLFSFAHQKGLTIQPPKMIGISHDSPDITDAESLRYDACVPVDESVMGEGEVGIQTIPGGKFAIFLHEGSYDNLKDTYQTIFTQWLPKSTEALRDNSCFEVYLNSMMDTPPESLQTEIYIPLQ